MVTFRELVSAFRKLEIDRTTPIIAHASLSAFGEVHGGAETVLGALLSNFDTLIMPSFTYRTMLIPESGPADNALNYGSGNDLNAMAEFFSPQMPADRLMGVVHEALRRHPKAYRSSHPILSFVGINAGPILDSQTLDVPLAPISMLSEAGGWVLLMGVDHTVNTSLHFAEQQAKRKQFIRWSLTPDGVVECPNFPGCSNGFQDIAVRLEGVVRRAQAGAAQVQAVPLTNLIETARSWIAADPLALLCNQITCERCQAVRQETALA
jgi:aminoglycoside 3-N-acetyltransferase